MAYGIELVNTSGRTLFSTEEDYTTLAVNTPVSNSSYGLLVPTGTGRLIARPQDGESGAIAIAIDESTSQRKFLGFDTYTQNWGAAQGIKYAFMQKTSDQLTAPTTSGYGMEVYESNGDILFSTSSNRVASVEAILTIEPGTQFKYYNPNGGFNDLYITADPAYITYLNNAYLLWYKIMGGCWAYFDHTEESITIVNNGNQSDASGTQKYWDDWDGVTFIPSTRNILVVRINGG